MNSCVEMNLSAIEQFYIRTLDPDQVQDITNRYMSMDPNNYALSHKVKRNKTLCFQTCDYGLYNSKNTLLGYLHGYYPNRVGAFWIQTFMILPKYLRQGMGTHFFMMMIEQIQINSPLTEIYLTCYDANAAGKSFWKSLGFNPIKHFTHSSEAPFINEDYSLMKIELKT